jgi:protein O-GlcNAc transferase
MLSGELNWRRIGPFARFRAHVVHSLREWAAWGAAFVAGRANSADERRPRFRPLAEQVDYSFHIMEDAMSQQNGSPVGLSDILCTSTCPACGHHVAVTFYDGGRQPLATVAWPRSAEEARAMKRLPLSFVRCVDCGHVYNRDFSYAEVPYSEKPNLMFNQGIVWTDHLRHVREVILKRLPAKPVVVEVGCGEGHLLRALAEALPRGRFVGFDPSNAINTGNGAIEARRELFVPERHLTELRPDLIISRHVMEHLMNPLGFIQAIAFVASWEDVETRLLIEVPCIDQVIQTGRTVDFFYEHNSNFTTISLERLLARCASRVELVERGYNGEVVFGLAQFQRQHDQVAFAREAVSFSQFAAQARHNVRADIDALAAGGKSIALWGGTGKAAAFINQFGLDAQRFPLVVDSDADKAGTFVPGTGQEIRFRDWLKQHPVDVILIATQWRAADIVLEIERHGIRCKTVLIEHGGRLIDYFAVEHPYRHVSRAA